MAIKRKIRKKNRRYFLVRNIFLVGSAICFIPKIFLRFILKVERSAESLFGYLWRQRVVVAGFVAALVIFEAISYWQSIKTPQSIDDFPRPVSIVIYDRNQRYLYGVDYSWLAKRIEEEKMPAKVVQTVIKEQGGLNRISWQLADYYLLTGKNNPIKKALVATKILLTQREEKLLSWYLTITAYQTQRSINEYKRAPAAVDHILAELKTNYSYLFQANNTIQVFSTIDLAVQNKLQQQMVEGSSDKEEIVYDEQGKNILAYVKSLNSAEVSLIQKIKLNSNWLSLKQGYLTQNGGDSK